MRELRPMYMSDLKNVLKIIHAHDEDDAEVAESDYRDEGFENQFVLELDEKVIGVTGYKVVPATDATFWLSWTYLDEAHRGQGFGKGMIAELLEKLKANNGRKIFVKVSDYEDAEEGKIYERALTIYKSLGFVEELIGQDFYDEGESQHILSCNLRSNNGQEIDAEHSVADEKPVIRFNGLHEISETEGSYTFNWVVKETRSFFGKRNFTAEDLRTGIEAIKEKGGRKIFLTFPSNLPLIHNALHTAGFKYVGKLADYYEHGVHELHFTHDLSDQ